MKFVKSIFIGALALFISHTGFSQFYVQDVQFQGYQYTSLETAKQTVEYNSSYDVAAIGGIEECNGCGNFDINVTLFDASGAVSASMQFGQSGVDEIPNAAIVSDFGNRIIVVGQIGQRDAFIAGIDVPALSVAWSHRIGDFTPGITENLTTVLSLNPGSGQYLAMGTATTSAGNRIIYSVGFDDAGGINWMRTIDDWSGNIVHFDPTNLSMPGTSASGVPMLTGLAENTSGQRSIFTTRVDPTNGAAYWFRTYNLTDGTNVADHIAGDVRGLTNGNWALAFSTTGLLSSSGTNSFITYMEIDNSMSPTTGVAYMYQITSGTFTHDWHFGIGVYEDNGDIDIGIRVGDFSAGVWDAVPGLLEIDASGGLLNHTLYFGHTPYEETGMTLGVDGYYLKGRHEDDKFLMVGIDFAGSSSTSCDFNMGITDHKMKVLTSADEFLYQNHGNDVTHSLPDQTTNGLNVDCNGGSATFKKATGIADLATDASVFPTVVSGSELVTIQNEALTGQRVQLQVVNTLGQVIYTSSNLVSGETIQLSGEHLSDGINLVTIFNEAGEAIISSRVIKE